MEEEAGHYTLSKKNKKKLKVVKNPQDQPNIAGPIKVEIDLTAEMAKQLSNKSLTDKVKLENNDETLPRNNLTPNARVKIENDTIYRDFALTKTKTEEPNQFHPNIIITSSNRNPQIIQMNTENILNLRTAVPSQILVTENHLGNYQFHHPNIHPTFSNNNVGMYQVMQDRYIKSLQNFMPSPNPMNYFGMLESSFANPFIYQEYMKLYMENMKKMYDLKK